MRNIVYLQECDSVRKSDEEMRMAKWAICHELVQQGHVIVFSLNQIADSHTMLSLLSDEKSKKYVLELFHRGWLRIGLYSNHYSLSDYILNSLNKNLNPDQSVRDEFIFSVLPVRYTDTLYLELVRRAISSGNSLMFSEGQDKTYPFLKSLCFDLKKEINKGITYRFTLDDIDQLLNRLNSPTSSFAQRMQNIHRYIQAMVELNAVEPVLYWRNDRPRYNYLNILAFLTTWEPEWEQYEGISKDWISLYENAKKILDHAPSIFPYSGSGFNRQHFLLRRGSFFQEE